ncbi:MAG TPA: hypothetical protein VFA43_02555 [Gemmatimonadaceae bacterium]|nr:hypothetical protein [Gemmatimonadaceae bacterium]
MRRRALIAAGMELFVSCSSSNSPTFPQVSQVPPASIVAGDGSACLLAQGGVTYCWGSDTGGALGIGSARGAQLLPVAVAGNHTFSSLSGAEFFRCGLSGALPLCWGQTLAGGNRGNLYSDSVPTMVALDVPSLATVSAGPSHACGLTKSGAAYCWGENYFGQLGVGDTLGRSTAVPVSGGIKWSAISVGFWHTCGLTVDSTAFCWGENLAGELGAPPDSLPLSTTPFAAARGLKFTSVTTGSLYTCGLTAAGQIYCWGWNYAGNLGDSTTTNRDTPTPIAQGNVAFKSVVASNANSIVLVTCGVTTVNAMYCWGWNGYGQLGNPNAPSMDCGSVSTNPASCSSLAPFLVAGGLQWASVSVGTTHTCGITVTNAAYCWGQNDHGQLGDGSTQPSAVPVAVSGALIAKDRVFIHSASR